jgi:hypothetical protein
MTEIDVQACAVSPFPTATGQARLCATTQRVPASSTPEQLRAVQATLVEAVVEGLEAQLGWPIDRGRIRVILQETPV